MKFLIYELLYSFAALSFATQNAASGKFGRMWGMEYLNTKFPLPTLLYARFRAE